MTLSPGSRLGAYEVVAHIGAGGMGEVFRARDTKLNRDVALKILPETFTHDPDRIARFKREAQVLASLNHPHIAQIFGLEEQDGPDGHAAVAFIAMELAEGEDLAQRIARGSIAIDDALAIARQIADALEAAHEQGIVHRDLKPANVKVRDDGSVKVLDFGLAKAVGPAEAGSHVSDGRGVRLPADFSASPTITTPAMTQAGMILGTAAYMSPEQAKGRAADKRSDIWAFGCVLYEMLTGKRPFEGEDISDTLAAVLRGDPDWTALPPDTPPHIRTLLRRCLQKDPKKRLPHIGIARLEIDEADGSAPIAGPATAAPAPHAWWRRAMPYAIGAIAASLVTIVVMWRAAGTDRATPQAVQRLTITLPPNTALPPTAQVGGLAISADGTRIVYPAVATDGSRALYLRMLDQLEARLLPGTENGGAAFFAPDGDVIGFFAGGNGLSFPLLKKVPIRGGAPVTIAQLPGIPVGASWSADGSIRAGMTRGVTGGPASAHSIFVVSAAGGTPQPIPSLTKGEGRSYGWPDALPDGKHLLVSVRTGPSYAAAHVDVTTLDGQFVRTVVDNGYHARYGSGYIVYMFARNLMAVPFNLSTLRPTGPPTMIAETIGTDGGGFGAENFDVSQTGTLVHGGVLTVANSPRRTLVWVDRKGREEPISAPLRAYTYPRISPDGSRVAIDIRDQANDIWIWDLNRRNFSRITTDPSQDSYPVWSGDGRRVMFASQRGGSFNLYVQNADGTGEAERLTESPNVQASYGITPDGTQLIFRETLPSGNDDLMAVSMNDPAAPAKQRRILPLLRTTFGERNADISPDGRWLAYESDESGRDEVYVRPFPNTDGGRWTVSSDGGSRPVWSRNGRELFYVAGTTPAPIRLMRVAVDATKGFSISVPQQLFEGRYYVDPSVAARGRSYDVAPDGQRFVMVKNTAAPEQPVPPQPLVVVLNWVEELKARASTPRP